jgi:hypothetical protein
MTVVPWFGPRMVCTSGGIIGAFCPTELAGAPVASSGKLGAMAKREIPIREKPPNNWVVYQIKGKRPLRFIGFVYNAPDKKTAIARAIEEYDVPAEQLIVLRDDR